jgi:CRP-like cAMP-binding protein
MHCVFDFHDLSPAYWGWLNDNNGLIGAALDPAQLAPRNALNYVYSPNASRGLCGLISRFNTRRLAMQILTHSQKVSEFPLTAEPGQTLFWEGDACTHIFELRSGIVRGVSILEEGERQVTAFFFAGDQIGIPVTPTYRYSAEPVTPVSYLRHPHSRWCDAMIENFRRDRRLLQSIGAEQDPVFRRGMLIGRSGALSRVAAFLTSIIDRLESCGPGLKFPLPQIDVASYLAVTPETVCRALKQLRKAEIIDMPSHDRLIIRDYARLEQAAHSPLA